MAYKRGYHRSAFCQQCGIAIRQDAEVFEVDVSRLLQDEFNDLTPAMPRLLDDPFDKFDEGFVHPTPL